MRPLNRPMFRYGGPIKEGIMQGMKDGGSLSPQFNTGLVGDERYPKAGGREKHALFLAPAVMPALATLGRFALRPLGKFAMRQFAGPVRQSLTGKGGQRLLTSGKPIKGGFQRNIFEPNVAGRYILGSPEAKFLTGAGGKISKAVSRGIKGTLRSPTATLLTAGAFTDILPGGKPFGPDKFLPNILGQRFDEQGNKIPGTGLFNPADGSAAAGAGEMKVVSELSEDPKVDPKKLKELNDNRIERTKKRYYELMGLDKMKKDAAYDSLIDASKIVQEEGADLKGAIRSGNLQNRIIQAISQNLDKSADLKKQIDAAVLKGEIEKDINKTKLTSFQEQIKFIKENPNDPLAKKLSGATSVADNLAALTGKTITSDDVQRLVESKGQEVKGQVKDDKYQKWEKNNEGKDEIDYLQDIFKGQTLDAGIYIINKKAIRIDEGGNAFPVDLDSIIG